MNRLQKKCVLASGIMHGSLVVLLLVGPAFLGSSQKPIDPKEFIDFIPYKTLEQNVSGGGSRNVPQVDPPAKPPEQKPLQSDPPKPRVEPHPDPEPPKPKQLGTPPKPVERNDKKSAPDSLELSKTRTRKVSTNMITRASSPPRNKDTGAENRARDKAEADRRAKQIAQLEQNIRTGASGGVSVELRGPGGGGVPYAGFNQALISAYMRAWLIPSDAADANTTVVAIITISRDGTILSSRVDRRSGNAELDKSVERALGKVPRVGPFPESMKDAQKTFWLEFDPKAKRMMG